MLWRIVNAEPRPEYGLWLCFEDGTEGKASVRHLVGKGVFKAWEDEAEFRKVSIDKESGTVTWPGGLDLAPDPIYDQLVTAGSTAPSSAQRRAPSRTRLGSHELEEQLRRLDLSNDTRDGAKRPNQ